MYFSKFLPGEHLLMLAAALYAGLKKLSYNCYHMSECNLDVANGSLANWHHAIDAKFNGKGRKYAAEDFDKMLWRYDVRQNLFRTI